jgi:hypothetical protein
MLVEADLGPYRAHPPSVTCNGCQIRFVFPSGCALLIISLLGGTIIVDCRSGTVLHQCEH